MKFKGLDHKLAMHLRKLAQYCHYVNYRKGTTGTDANQDGVFTDDFPPSGRNSERPDASKIRNWSKNVDLRLTKYFNLMGGTRLAVIVDAYNVFNWTNYLTYQSRLNAHGPGGVSTFAIPTSASNPRQVQLGARVLF